MSKYINNNNNQNKWKEPKDVGLGGKHQPGEDKRFILSKTSGQSNLCQNVICPSNKS